MNLKVKKTLLLLALAPGIFISGCASAPSTEEIANANYGRDMRPEECIALAERVIGNSLKDPGSAQFRHTGACFKGYWGSVPIAGMKAAFGWLQVGEINGKNSYGGYVGFRQYQVLIRDGIAIRYCMADKDGFCIPEGR
jgi:hypothetical protein